MPFPLFLIKVEPLNSYFSIIQRKKGTFRNQWQSLYSSRMAQDAQNGPKGPEWPKMPRMAQKAQNGPHAQKVQNLPKRPRISNILGYSGPFWAWPRMPKIFKTHFFLGHPVDLLRSVIKLCKLGRLCYCLCFVIY